MLAEGDSAAGGSVRLRFAKVAMQPGKPQGHGTVRIEDGGTHREVPVITLPGNPVSVLVLGRRRESGAGPRKAAAYGHSGRRPAGRGRG